MAQAQTEFIQTVDLRLKLSAKEAEALKDMMQNPRVAPERQEEFDVRKAIFNALKGVGV